MRAAWYEQQGLASRVLVTGEMDTPRPGPGELRIRVAASGINPGDVKKRQDSFGVGMPYPRVIPHSDGAGVVDEVGSGALTERVGKRVWCFGAQSNRPFGTAAEYVIVPTEQAVALPDGIGFVQGACLGIPGITAHRAVHVAGPVAGRSVLVQGGAGAVGQCAVALARHAGARVIATTRSKADEEMAQRAGAHHLVRSDGRSPERIVQAIRELAPQGIDHVVEVAFHANIEIDEAVLGQGGSIASYATGDANPTIPFWPLAFKNVALYFLGSDDFPEPAKADAARDLNAALVEGWAGLEIGAQYDLADIAEAHEAVEQRKVAGQVVLTIP